MSRTLIQIALIALVVATAAVWLPLLSSPALDSIVLSPGFTAVAIFGAIVVSLAPIGAIAFIIRDTRPAGRSEPEGGK